MVKNKSIYLWCLLLAVLLILLLREAWVIVFQHILIPDWNSFSWKMLSWPNVFKHFNSGLYWWFFVGFLIYLVLRRFIIPRFPSLVKRIEGAETHAHEFAHLLIGLLHGRDIKEVVVKKDSGHILSSGPAWTIPATSLAPYAFPFFTYVGLALRSMIAWQSTWLFDILVGMTLGFHVNCFVKDTGNHQTDINQFSTLLFPYLFIAVFNLFNFNVFAVTFWNSKNLFTAIWWVVQHLFVF